MSKISTTKTVEEDNLVTVHEDRVVIHANFLKQVVNMVLDTQRQLITHLKESNTIGDEEYEMLERLIDNSDMNFEDFEVERDGSN